jgi:hypothetical protein
MEEMGDTPYSISLEKAQEHLDSCHFHEDTGKYECEMS